MRFKLVPLIWSCDQYWSADTLFWQVSINHNMDVQYQRCSYQKTWVAPQSFTLAYMYMEGWTAVRSYSDQNQICLHRWVYHYYSLTYGAPLMGRSATCITGMIISIIMRSLQDSVVDCVNATKANGPSCTTLRAHRRIYRALLRKWNVTSGNWRHHIMSWQENPLTSKSHHTNCCFHRRFSSPFLALVLGSTAHA